MNQFYGIYKGICTDNSEFFSKGKIKVRVEALYTNKLPNDLANNFSQQQFEKDLANDLYAYVYTPIGGGFNHGLFALPQVNSIGVVQFLDGNINKPIWMGYFFNPVRNSSGELQSLNVPSDKNTEDSSVTSNGESNLQYDPPPLILRTKHNAAPNGSADNMNWRKKETENLIVLSSEKLEIKHFVDWNYASDGTPTKSNMVQSVTFSDYDTYDNPDPMIEGKVEVYEENTDNLLVNSSFTLNANESKLEYVNNDEKIANSASVGFEKVEISSRSLSQNKSTSVEATPDNVLMKNKQNVIFVESNDITIRTDGLIRLSGNSVILGPGAGDQYIVTSNNPAPSRLEDGSILTKQLAVKV